MLRELMPHLGMVAATAVGVYGFNWLIKKFPIA